jgi:non-heme chloroperoxidase
MPYIHAQDGTRLFYSAWGAGEPVLFIHGGNVGSGVWEFQVPALVAKGFECITYDQRGFDRSDVSATDYSIDTLAGDLDELIRHLDRPNLSAVTLSFGGCVLARYLKRYGSEQVKRAALVSTVAPFPCRSEDNPDGLDPERAYEPFLRGMIEDRAQTFLDNLDLFFNPAGAEHPVTEGARTWIINLGLRNLLVPMLEIYRASFFEDVRADMSAFTMPTLLVHGEADVFAPLTATAARAQRMIFDGRLITYPDASHGLMFTHRNRLNRDLGEFLKSALERRPAA